MQQCVGLVDCPWQLQPFESLSIYPVVAAAKLQTDLVRCWHSGRSTSWSKAPRWNTTINALSVQMLQSEDPTQSANAASKQGMQQCVVLWEKRAAEWLTFSQKAPCRSSMWLPTWWVTCLSLILWHNLTVSGCLKEGPRRCTEHQNCPLSLYVFVYVRTHANCF